MISIAMLTLSLSSTVTLGSEQSAVATAISLPPIDLAAPPGFETASFGLG